MRQIYIVGRLISINKQSAKVQPILWYLHYTQLDSSSWTQVFINKEGDYFWYLYASWYEINMLKINQNNFQSSILSNYNSYLDKLEEINNKEWLSVDELSKYTDTAVGTLYNYVSKGEIPHTKTGGLKFNRIEIDNWLNAKSFNPDEIKKEMKRAKQ